MRDSRKIAFYLRCSVEQEKIFQAGRANDMESDTIVNQRRLLYEAASERGLDQDQIVEYVDDGYTGVNFERPAFKQLIQDIDENKIGILMVKDLSRLGRDYIGVGQYVESVFPQKLVRVISINDNWDSMEHLGETMELDTAFRTVLYDMYSRDISVKRKSANMARNKRGIYSGGYVPYGYKKRKGDVHSLLIDEETAPVVRKIYRMYLQGEKVGDIARDLNDKKIPAPGLIKMENHHVQGTNFSRNLWTTRMVRTILDNETYTGTLVLNRYTSNEIRAKSLTINPEEEWMKYPGHHEAIISMKDFQEVRKKSSKKEIGESSGEKRSMPLYCGHCGSRLTPTTRNEHTFICRSGNMVPVRPCGQIEIRKEAVQKLLVKAVNLQAKLFLEEAENSRIESKDLLRLHDDMEKLTMEKEKHHTDRMNLYRMLKEGMISREQFLAKKQEIMAEERECQIETEATQARIDKVQIHLQNRKIDTDTLDEYAVLDHYDHDAVNHLISRVECYNDGHIKIIWNFRSEFKDAKRVDDAEEVLKASILSHTRVAAYTSDLWLMPQEEEWTVSRDVLRQYCRDQLKVKEDEIAFFHDDRSDTGIFFREGYMKFIDLARREAADILVIRRFSDLYLSAAELNKLLRWTLPKLDHCRFLSIEDHFDSRTAGEREYQTIYQKYRKTRRSDLMSYRMWEIKTGRRKAEEPRKPRCRKLFGYHIKEDGCYADRNILSVVEKIYQKLDETESFPEVFRWLNEESIPTASSFFQTGGEGDPGKEQKWNSERVWYVTKQEEYASYCRHYERCRALGRHCEKRPIIAKELYDEVNRKCRYRNR